MVTATIEQLHHIMPIQLAIRMGIRDQKEFRLALLQRKQKKKKL